MKRILSVIIVFVMCVSLTLTGCSDSDKDVKETTGTTDKNTTASGSEETEIDEKVSNGDEEPYNVTFVIYYHGGLIGDLDVVEAAINEITLERINCTVTLQQVSFFEANTKFSLWVANDEKVDIVSTLAIDYEGNIENNAFVRLDDMLEEHAPYLSSIDEIHLGPEYNGGIYGIPIMQSTNGESSAIVVRTDIMNEVGLNYESYEQITFEQLDEMFAFVNEKYPDMVQYGVLGTLVSSDFNRFRLVEDFGNDCTSGVLMNFEEDTEIVNLFETDEYREFLEWRRKWNQAGYISADAATTTDSVTNWIKSGRCFSSAYVAAEPGTAEYWTRTTGYDMTLLALQGPCVLSKTYALAPFAIPITSKRPEKALEFLDLLYESKELSNLLTYGVEGVHYEMVEGEDMIIEIIEDSAYRCDLGIYGNKMNEYLVAPADSSVIEESVAFNEKALEKKSKAVGYKFSTESVVTELTAIKNVYSEYLGSLEYGFVDIDTVLPQFQQALKDAGIEKVIAENQAQFNEWLKSQE